MSAHTSKSLAEILKRRSLYRGIVQYITSLPTCCTWYSKSKSKSESEINLSLPLTKHDIPKTYKHTILNSVCQHNYFITQGTYKGIPKCA